MLAAMRWLHTADWHLGRIFHGVHLTSDQAHLLDQVVTLAREARVDAVLVCGDIYDRAVPPPEAVALLDDVLSRLVLEINVPVILISGNHDSPQRIGFASRVLRRQGLHAAGQVTLEPRCVVLEDRHGPVCFYPLPYAEPAVVRELFERGADPAASSIRDHDSAMAARLTRLDCQRRGPGQREVLLAHGVVVGAEQSESERPLATGEAGNIAPERFSSFHYVALGHLHRPQAVVAHRVEYPGSLHKYSFGEASQTKSVSVVEMDRDGTCRVDRVSISPRRDVRRIEGTLEQLLRASDPSPDDYLMVSLLDVEPVLDAMGRLHAVYPNVLHIERPCLFPNREGAEAHSTPHEPTHPGHQGELELFSSFFAQVTGEPLDDDAARVFAEVVDSLRRREREAQL
jgi:exonuclease SbcD